METSMRTVAGRMFRNTVRCGIRRAFRRDGCHIATVIGPTWLPGAGPGLRTSLGDLLRFITDAGRRSIQDGVGCRDLSPSRPCMRQRWSPLWEDQGFRLALAS